MPSTISISDKKIHIFAYFLLTLSWFFAFKKESEKLKISIIILVVIFTYGIIIEVLQGTVTENRQPEAYDLLANLTGIILAITIFKQVLQKKLLNQKNIIAKVVLKLLNQRTIKYFTDAD